MGAASRSGVAVRAVRRARRGAPQGAGRLALVVLFGALCAGCGAGAPLGSAPTTRPAPGAHASGRTGRDPKTATALLRIARAFNLDYADNRDAAVYARWDPASRRIISRAAYLARHRACPQTGRVAPVTWGVTRGPGGAWLVHYSISGEQFVDWWYYIDGRFEFDLARSNPSAVSLYRAPPARYMALAGCDY